MGTFSGLPGITEKIPLKISSRLLIQCLIVFHFDRFSCCDGELTGNFIAKSFRPQEIKNFLTLCSLPQLCTFAEEKLFSTAEELAVLVPLQEHIC